MKSALFALSFALLLSACDSIGLPYIFAPDQVPDNVKAAPTPIAATPPSDVKTWPRLGDVPFKPKDFSPPPVYDHYMDEMEYQRDEGEADKAKIERESPASAADKTGIYAPPLTPQLIPPQLPPPSTARP